MDRDIENCEGFEEDNRNSEKKDRDNDITEWPKSPAWQNNNFNGKFEERSRRRRFTRAPVHEGAGS